MAEITINGMKYNRSSPPDATDKPQRPAPMVRAPHSSVGRELANMPPHLRGAFLKSKGFFGAKQGSVFKIRLPVTPIQWISTITTGVLAQTAGIATNACAGVADWEAVFAEYRIVKGVFQLHSSYMQTPSAPTGATSPYAVFGINYESSMATPSSVAQVIQYDQPRFGCHTMTKPITIPFDLNKVFGEIWTNGGTYTTFALLAAYGVNYGSSQVATWYVTGHFDVEYRGLA